MENEINAIWTGYLAVKEAARTELAKGTVTRTQYLSFMDATFRYADARETIVRERYA